MKKELYLLGLMMICLSSVNAQPYVQWQKCLGGTSNEKAYSVINTSDGGYLLTGYTTSTDGDVTGNHGDQDSWIIKLDSSGAVQWNKCLGGTELDILYFAQQTNDGGYLFAGNTHSNNGDAADNTDSLEVNSWIVKLDQAGNIQWKKCYGGSGADGAFNIQQLADNGYIFTGFSFSNDGDVSGGHGAQDVWVVRLDSAGSIVWQKCYGGTGSENGRIIKQISDNGFVIMGVANSADGDISGGHGGNDYLLMKIDSVGNLLWQRCYGGSGTDVPGFRSLVTLNNGNFIIGGYSSSTDGDVTGNHGSTDLWVVEVDSAGGIVWKKTYGGADYDGVNFDIQKTIDNGFILTGASKSNDFYVTGNHGDYDFWVVKIDSAGTQQWELCYGGSYVDLPYSIKQLPNGEFVAAGYTASDDGDVWGLHGTAGSDQDIWIVKLSAVAGVNETVLDDEIKIYPNPANEKLTLELSSIKGAASISVCNIMGDEILKQSIEQNKNIIDISALASGMYFIKIGTKEGRAVKKFIKE